MTQRATPKTTLNRHDEQTCIGIFRDLLHARHRLYKIASTVAGDAGLHAAELNVIDILGKMGPISMGRLSDETFVSPANTTYTVRKLEVVHLVQRLRSKDSERSVTVALTKKGQTLFRRCYPAVLTAVDNYLSERLSSTDKKNLARILARLAT
ncbi:MAG: winged helix-turn-helix transcriptional regulator [Gammaproteobacteria bacterium]|nr:winged helix-turn-helix transcriptional regulator [Gammaproteobacteria bacterium]